MTNNNPQDITRLTLGQLLTHPDQTIRRLAGSILKLLQRKQLPATMPDYETAKDPELKKQIFRIHQKYHN